MHVIEQFIARILHLRIPDIGPGVFPSAYHDTITVGHSFGKKTLFTGAISQSGGEYPAMWDHTMAAVSERQRQAGSCLLLGVAGATAIHSVRKRFPECRITGIEIDPQMIHVAAEHFQLHTISGLTLVTADACDWVFHTDSHYDLIICDMFLRELNPPCSRTERFLKRLSQLISPEGTIVYNCHYRTPDEHDFFVRQCEKSFERVTEIFTFPRNKVLLLSR